MSLRQPPADDANGRRRAAPPCAASVLAGAPVSGPLFSDAIGLMPGRSLDASHHPTTSVGLHAGPVFAPQHPTRSRPADGGLDIHAMVAARRSDLGDLGDLGDLDDEEATGSWWDNMSGGAKRLSDKAKSLAGEAAKMAKGAAVKTKDAAKGAAKKKWDRFTNEDRITNMERYDYRVYSSQPLKNVMLKAGQGSVTFGGMDDPMSAVPKKKKINDSAALTVLNFYGMLAVANKKVATDKQGQHVFELESKTTWLQSDPLTNNPTLQKVFLIPDRDATAMVDVDAAATPLYNGTDLTKGVDEVVQRVRAQTRSQTEGLAAANDASQLAWKPGGAQRLCLGHSMMVPLSSVMDDRNQEWSYLRKMLPTAFLESIESGLVWHSLRKGFQKELGTDGASHKPYIIPMVSSYLKGEARKTSADYMRAFPETTPDGMAPISALLVVPIDAATLGNPSVFQHTDGCLTMEYTRLYPWQQISNNDAYMNKTDTAMAMRTKINEQYEAALQAEETPPDDEWKLNKAKEIATAVRYIGADGNRTADANAHATWCMKPERAANKFKVMVFALGVNPACANGASNEECTKAFDANDANDAAAAGGGILTIGTHPLLLGDVADENGISTGFQAPGTVWMSHGQARPLANAFAAAITGEHIDVRFLWAAMKLAQCSWNKATSNRTSELTRTKFRKLVGMPMSSWKTPNTPIDKLNMVKGNKFNPQRNDASDPFGAALIRMGLTDATGAPLDLEDLSSDAVEAAMIASGMDLDDCCDSDSDYSELC